MMSDLNQELLDDVERGERWLYCYPDEAFAEY